MTALTGLPIEFDAAVRSVPELLSATKAGPHWPQIERTLFALPQEAVSTLLDRVETVTSPLVLWAVHWELDRRDVPPCLRQSRGDSLQEEYLTWLADLLWLIKRAPSQSPLFTRWRGVFTHSHNAAQWHKTARWVYGSARGRHGHYFAKGLALTDQQRQPLLTMPTMQMQADRRLLRRMPEMHERLLTFSLQHPDRSGVRSPELIAARRGELLRLFILAGRQQTLAVCYLQLLTGEALSRQSMSRQLDLISEATELRKLKC